MLTTDWGMAALAGEVAAALAVVECDVVVPELLLVVEACVVVVLVVVTDATEADDAEDEADDDEAKDEEDAAAEEDPAADAELVELPAAVLEPALEAEADPLDLAGRPVPPT